MMQKIAKRFITSVAFNITGENDSD